jgi:hypothetical protein
LDRGRKSVFISHPSKGTGVTKSEAQKILDEIRSGFGHDYTEACTLECLNLTGDLGTHETMRSPGMDEPIREEGYRARLRQRAIMVARSKE